MISARPGTGKKRDVAWNGDRQGGGDEVGRIEGGNRMTWHRGFENSVGIQIHEFVKSQTLEIVNSCLNSSQRCRFWL